MDGQKRTQPPKGSSVVRVSQGKRIKTSGTTVRRNVTKKVYAGGKRVT